MLKCSIVIVGLIPLEQTGAVIKCLPFSRGKIKFPLLHMKALLEKF